MLCQLDGGPLTRQMVQRGIARVARRAGLSNLGVHILRHTFCSHLAMRGVPPSVPFKNWPGTPISR